MQIITLKEVSNTSLCTRFRQPPLAHLIAAMVFVGLIIGAIYWHNVDEDNFPVGALVSCSVLFGLPAWLCLSAFKKSLAPSNWILLVSPNQILVKFRSYLNSHFPEDDPQVVQFHPAEIEYAIITKQKITRLGSINGRTRRITSFHTFLDLSIVEQDLKPLKEQIKYERNQKAPQKGKFIKHRSRSRHYPVSVVDNKVVRIEWRSHTEFVTPGVKKALAKLSEEGIRIEGLQKEVIDLTHGKDDQKLMEDNILYLVERGNVLTATQMARKAYGLSLAEAKEFVEDLIK